MTHSKIERKRELHPDHHPTPGQRLEYKHGFDQARVCELIAQERGMLAYVATKLGVRRQKLYSYISQNVTCAQALHDAREAMGDVAERKLHELIEAGDVRSIIYYLSTIHKRRGYGLKNNEDVQLGEIKQIVNTVNIVSIPSGQYLSKEQIDSLTIDGVAALPTPPELAACLQ